MLGNVDSLQVWFLFIWVIAAGMDVPGLYPLHRCKTLHLIDSDEDNLWEADSRETKEEIATRGMKFLNCMTGSDPATTNYPGKIPSGLDLPSNVADEKLSNGGEGK
ncbi:hypothetical protein V6N11_020306 [Hibiscus sabdariffa]|uniref:Uncharacterized protein n=1 Tax=Hibiscus sabdariffa TaxID=183260 RepID=A0ABR2Q816_9ROSI